MTVWEATPIADACDGLPMPMPVGEQPMILTDTHSSWTFEMQAYGIDSVDAEWLRMTFRVSDSQREWWWISSCLMFSEVKDLVAWLRRMAESRPVGDAVDFIEPEIGFELMERSDSATIRLYLRRGSESWGQGFMGEWSSDERSGDEWFEVYHDFTMSLADVRAAADSLLDDLRRLGSVPTYPA